MKTIRIKAAEFEGNPLPPQAELCVLRAEIAKLEAMDPGSDVPFGRDSVCSREMLLGAYRRRLDVVTQGLEESAEDSLDVRLEIEDKAQEAFSVGLVQLGEDGQPVVRADDLSAAALVDSIKQAEMGSPALKRLREIIEQAKLTPEEADQFLRKIAQLAAMNHYANLPSEEYHKKAFEARLNRLAERGFVVPQGLPDLSKLRAEPAPPQAKMSKLERKLRRQR